MVNLEDICIVFILYSVHNEKNDSKKNHVRF